MEKELKLTELVTREEVVELLELKSTRSLYGPGRYEDRYEINTHSVATGTYLELPDVIRLARALAVRVRPNVELEGEERRRAQTRINGRIRTMIRRIERERGSGVAAEYPLVSDYMSEAEAVALLGFKSREALYRLCDFRDGVSVIRTVLFGGRRLYLRKDVEQRQISRSVSHATG